MDAGTLMVRRSLDEIATELWPELLRAEGLPDVDAATVDRMTRTALPALRAARDSSAPNYALAADTRGQVGQILSEARYRQRPERDVTVTDFLDVKRREISDRLEKLKPAVDEYSRLEAAASALAKVGAAPASTATTTAATVATPPRRRPGRPRGSGKAASAATATPKVGAKKVGRPPGKKVGRPPASGKKIGRPAARAGRRKGSGTRAAQALSFVQGQPGITIPELAAKMGIKQNYLYRVLPDLEQEGKLEKQGRGWHPRG
jgi:hypothetical protein